MTVNVPLHQVRQLVSVIQRQSPEFTAVSRLCLDTNNDVLFLELVVSTVLRAQQEEDNIKEGVKKYREGVEDGRQFQAEQNANAGEADEVPSDRTLGDSDTDSTEDFISLTRKRKRCKVAIKEEANH